MCCKVKVWVLLRCVGAFVRLHRHLLCKRVVCVVTVLAKVCLFIIAHAHTHMCVAKARNAWSSLQVAEMVCLFARAGNHLHAAEARTPNFGMNCSFCIVWV